MKLFLAVIIIALIAILLVTRLRPTLAKNSFLRLIRKVNGLSPKFIEADGLNWPYLEAGEGNEEVIVFIHGYAVSKDDWPIFAGRFRHNYRVICPDLPGFAENLRDATIDISPSQQIHRLKAFFTAMGLEKFHLVGHSMGGFVVSRYAMEYGDDLLSLSVFAGAGVSTPSMIERLQDPQYVNRNPLAVTTLEEMRELLTLLMKDPPYTPSFILRAMVEEFTKHKELLDQQYQVLVDEFEAGGMNDDLAKISVPTLLCYGEEDQVIHADCGRVMDQQIENSKLVVYPNIGHVLMIECTKELEKDLRQHLEANSA